MRPTKATTGSSGSRPSAARAARRSPGVNVSQVDAGVHHVDAVGIGVVQRNQLRRFVFGVDDQPVGLVDHLLLADRAHGGSGVSPSASARS